MRVLSGDSTLSQGLKSFEIISYAPKCITAKLVVRSNV